MNVIKFSIIMHVIYKQITYYTLSDLLSPFNTIFKILRTYYII